MACRRWLRAALRDNATWARCTGRKRSVGSRTGPRMSPARHFIGRYSQLARKKRPVSGVTSRPIMATIIIIPIFPNPHWEQRRACITHPRIADGRDCRLHGDAALARAGAMVGFARTGRFRGMRRYRGEGGHQGSQNRGAVGVQREIRWTAQAGRRLYLFRFHAEPEVRYRRPQSDTGRAEAYRRATHRLSRQSTTKQHRGSVRGEATTVAAGLAED